MSGTVCIPLRRSNREAAGLTGDETLDVEIALDRGRRVVNPPRDLSPRSRLPHRLGNAGKSSASAINASTRKQSPRLASPKHGRGGLRARYE